MTDTEKAISLLQQCLDERPYAAVRVSQIMSCIQEAVELLKEQEPVKPEQYLIGQPEYKFYRCPVCKVAWYYKGNYCLNCGRAVKWDD